MIRWWNNLVSVHSMMCALSAPVSSPRYQSTSLTGRLCLLKLRFWAPSSTHLIQLWLLVWWTRAFGVGFLVYIVWAGEQCDFEEPDTASRCSSFAQPSCCRPVFRKLDRWNGATTWNSDKEQHQWINHFHGTKCGHADAGISNTGYCEQ